eukprot:7376409-Prymnesium_polylepis.10
MMTISGASERSSKRPFKSLPTRQADGTSQLDKSRSPTNRSMAVCGAGMKTMVKRLHVQTPMFGSQQKYPTEPKVGEADRVCAVECSDNLNSC